MTTISPLSVALVANSMRSVDDRLTAPHMEIIRGLGDGLRDAGHRVTIHGVSDGATPVRSIMRSHWPALRATFEERVRSRSRAAQQEMGRILDGLAFARETSHLVDAVRHANRHADILHLHWAGHLFGALLSDIPVVYTQHYTYDDPDFWMSIKERVFAELPGLQAVHWVVLSQSQARFLSDRTPRNHIHVAPHGLDFSEFPAQPGKQQGYVAFLGRIMRIKAPHLAIDAARRAGAPIRIAGSVDPTKEGEPEYFRTEIEPRLGSDATYLGELGFTEKIDLLRGAVALVNPFQMEEAFGLVMVESLACGTPLIVPYKGSAKDIVREGENGFFAETVEEMAAAIDACRRLDSRAIQRDVRRRYSRQRMIHSYLAIYRKALGCHESPSRGKEP